VTEDCKSTGIEVVPARVEYCQDYYYELEEYYTKQAKEAEEVKEESPQKDSESEPLSEKKLAPETLFRITDVDLSMVVEPLNLRVLEKEMDLLHANRTLQFGILVAPQSKKIESTPFKRRRNKQVKKPKKQNSDDSN